MILPIAIAVSDTLAPEIPPEELDVPAGIPYNERLHRLSSCVDQLRRKSVAIGNSTITPCTFIQNPSNEEGSEFTNILTVLTEPETVHVSHQPSHGVGLAELRISKALQLSTAYGANIGGLATLIGAYPNMVLKINLEKY
jgi:di/tricarboxylate transporter